MTKWFDTFAAPGTSPARRDRRRVPLGVLAAALIAVIGAGIWFVVAGVTHAPAAAPLPPATFSQQPAEVPDLVGGPLPSIGAPPASASQSQTSQTAPESEAAIVTDKPVPSGQPGRPDEVQPAAQVTVRRGQDLVEPLQNDQLVIPALNIRARAETTGIDAGELVIPGDVDQVTAWTGSAPLTGDTGTVLIAGHVDNAQQGAGALHDLYLAQPGDVVYVTGGGVVTRWKITALHAIPKADLPGAELFVGRSGPRLLRLVTCGGTVHDGSYDQNVIATATPF